jgi:solute carrier family 6 amino acid/orphan transporter-like 15/16/17/18/20
VFTETINKLPLPTLWAIMFFFMLVTVGIDTEFGMLEGVVTPIMDMKIFPNLRKEVLSGKFQTPPNLSFPQLNLTNQILFC